MEIRLYNKETGSLIGLIGSDDLQLLIDQFEEESSTDVDYFVDQDAVDFLEDGGASATLVSLLRSAIGESDGIDIRWEKG